MTSESTDRFSKAKALAAAGKNDQAEALLRKTLESHPQQEKSLVLLADLRRKAGDRNEARALFQRAWAAGNRDPRVGHRYAKLLMLMRQPDEAETVLRQLLEVTPEHAESRLQLVGLRRRQRDVADADALLEQGWSLRPGEPLIALALADRFLAKKQLPEAEAVLRQALEGAPKQVDVLAKLAELRRRQDDPAEAEALLRRAWTVQPAAAAVALDLAKLMIRGKRTDDAETVLRQTLEAAPGETEVRLQLAELRRRDDRTEAEALLREAWSAQPGTTAIALDLVKLLLLDQRTEEAEAVLQRSLESTPNELDLRLQLATLLRRRGSVAEAEAVLRQGWALQPDAVIFVLELSRTFLFAGQTEQARTVLLEGLESLPEHPELLLALGHRQAVEGHEEDAVATFKRAIATPESPAEAWIGLANTLGRQISARQTLEILVQALAAKKDDPAIHCALGHHLLSMGYITEAEQLVAAAVGRFSGDANLAALAVMLATLRGRYDEAHATLEAMPEKKRPDQRLKTRMAAGLLKAQWRVDEALDVFRQPDMRELDGQEYRTLSSIQLMALDVAGARQSIGHSHRLIRRLQGRNVSRGLTGEIVNDFWTDAQALAAAQEARKRGSLRQWVETVNANRHHTGCALGFLIHLRQTGFLDEKPVHPDHRPIPRHIHQFWDTPELPDDVAALMGSWRGRNPEWGYTRHTLASAREWVQHYPDERLLRAFRHMPAIAGKADLLRLAILHVEGGVYADADDRCLAPLDPFLAGHDMVLRQEHYGTIGNNFLAVRPGHPVIGQALEEAITSVLRGDRESIWLSSGPGLITRVLASYLVDDPRRLETLGREILVCDQPRITHFCASGCRASYKSSERYWQAGEFNTLPQTAQRPSGSPAALAMAAPAADPAVSPA
ncbi:tetratricopeptide repeat protein [Ancylobacter sonchi]|uniref:tetratricopeptide repeat protein n=1 Tax=Ancylobacter sonchi TaxID=1937790 RepID=UPI001BD403B8|nr:tetratricopeptide repeat protein [Ancylobacter sonchi]MBS7536414.1 tetratricopeptide repeat protein [Ancylobacter sonchi]